MSSLASKGTAAGRAVAKVTVELTQPSTQGSSGYLSTKKKGVQPPTLPIPEEEPVTTSLGLVSSVRSAAQSMGTTGLREHMLRVPAPSPGMAQLGA